MKNNIFNTLTVIIPTYKNRGGLINSVESALTQKCSYQVEVIVIDDNDPDSDFRKSTENLMSRYAENPSVIYLRHEVNKNGAAARNTGIKASNGEFIAFLDDDDLFLEGKLEAQSNYLKDHPEFDAVYCLAQRGKYGCSQKVIEGDGSRDILLLQSNFFTPSLMFRREALEAINGFDESFRRHQDYEILLRFFAKGFKIGCVPKVLIEIGLNDGENIPTGRKAEDLKSYFFEKFDSYIRQEDIKTPGFKKQVYSKHYACLFLNHIKHKHWKLAWRSLRVYLPMSPRTFIGVIFNSIKAHI